jgi:hypothetical protein
MHIVREPETALGFNYGFAIYILYESRKKASGVRMAASRSRDYHWYLALDRSLVLALAVAMYNIYILIKIYYNTHLEPSATFNINHKLPVTLDSNRL